MKKLIFAALICVCAVGCAAPKPAETTEATPNMQTTAVAEPTLQTATETLPPETTAEVTLATSTETTTITTTAETTTEVTMYLPPAYSEKELKNQAKDAKANGTLTVIIDPGHGIADPGAMHSANLGDTTEAMLDMAIARKLETELVNRGYTVVFTHDGVTKPATEWDDGKALFGPSERCSFANEQDAQLFISLHCDAYPQNDTVNGVRIYYPVNTPYSTSLDKKYAKAVSAAVDKAFPDAKDPTLMAMYGEECYTVLYKTRVPSLLVECGFITNLTDAQNLLSEDWQTAFAVALANGIDAYFE